MKILQINATYKIGSTGKIMSDLNDVILKSGHESFMLCGYAKEKASNLYVIDDIFDYPLNNKKNILMMRLQGKNGYTHKAATKRAIKWIETIKPDVIHIHNVHGNWINLKVLFEYIRISKIRMIWTFHDCWPFTGRCSHFEMCGCEKWKNHCYGCANKKVYPITYWLDYSKKMFDDKKKMYGATPMTIVAPSDWLGNYVKESFLAHNKIITIHNGIDTELFKKSETSLSYKYGNKRIILGVAASWSKRKGFDDLIKLDEMIDHNKFQIILVGLNDKQMKILPKTIIGIKRTNNQQELVDLYSNAYVFVNPTYEDNYPTVNLEAQACGCPVITYRTGGSPESVPEKQVFEKGDIEGIFSSLNSLKFELSDVQLNKDILFRNYINLYLYGR